MSDSTRNVCITAVDEAVGFHIALAILAEEKFSKKITSLTGLTLKPSAERAQQLLEKGVNIVAHVPGFKRHLVRDLTRMGCDTICVVPPVHQDKLDLTLELISAAYKAGVSNLLLISSAGAEYATKKQPRLREFIELETAVLSATDQDCFARSPCVIRAGLSIASLLNPCIEHGRYESLLTLPLGPNHNLKFAPVAPSGIAYLAAHVLTGRGECGFDERHLRQIMVVTGPALYSGEELAAYYKYQYEDISEAEARRLFVTQLGFSAYETDYFLEYFSLVREGKTNYVATTAINYVTESA